MTYATRGSATNRTATVLAVALIQGGAIYALVTGLVVVITPEAPKPPLSGYQVPAKPPPAPPSPVDNAAKQNDPVTNRTQAGNPPIQPQPPIVDTFELGPALQPPIGEIGTFDPPQQPFRQLFTPRNAAPRGQPGNWATERDYPAADQRAGNEGVTRFRLSIDMNGMVQSCSIIGSSGFASLDEATCRKVSQRARFEPAMDGYGSNVTGSYTGSIRWEIRGN